MKSVTENDFSGQDDDFLGLPFRKFNFLYLGSVYKGRARKTCGYEVP